MTEPSDPKDLKPQEPQDDAAFLEDFDDEFDDDFEEETDEERREADAVHEGDFSKPVDMDGSSCNNDFNNK